MCFPAVAAPVSSCQYTMVPLQGLALVGHCPLDAHMAAPHGVYPANGECNANGKPHHPTRCQPGLQQVKRVFVNKPSITRRSSSVEYIIIMRLHSQEEADFDMECDTLLPQAVSNGHLPVYHYSTRYV